MTIDGRSPNRPRQLHDLRLMPTATDPRPMFVWSAEGDRDTAITQSEFPKLLWHGETNLEITVTSRQEETEKLAQGFVFLPATVTAASAVEDLTAAFAGLSDDEKHLILEAQAKQRRDAITAKLADLSPEALDRLLMQAAEPQAKKRGRPAKVA